jgi:hypothetical protein
LNSQRYSTALKGIRHTSQGLILQAYRQQFLEHTEKQIKPIPFRGISLLYVKIHELPIEDIHKTQPKKQKRANPNKEPNKPEIIPPPSQDPNFVHTEGVTPSYQSSRSPAQPNQ